MSSNKSDARKTLEGMRALWRYSRTEDDVPFAISMLSTKVKAVQAGVPCAYVCKLTNGTGAARWLRLLVDIYLKDDQTHPHGHYAYFEKKIHVPARASRIVEFEYDWAARAALRIGGTRASPECFWRGDCTASGAYLVKALLFGEDGKPIDELRIVQHLTS